MSARARRPARCVAVATMLLVLAALPVGAAPPVVYGRPFHQSPVRGEPDDLLLLPGHGFSAGDVVVYQSLAVTTEPLVPPSSLPARTTERAGIAPVVSTANVPHSLTVRLPGAMAAGRSYALWVRNGDGEWSNGVRINDARPLWITPARVHATAAVASLPRRIKVVGRNLEPPAGGSTAVRLAGPRTFTLIAHDDGNPSTALERYAAIVDLPPSMPIGEYSVSVSRDGRSWVPLEGQSLAVVDDPAARPDFPVDAHGPCVADDDHDDTPCVVAAIAAAADAGGGTVVLGPGVWDLASPSTPGVTADGMLVPWGVSLRGSGATQTTLVRHAAWTPATFVLRGRNTVRGLRFVDARIYSPDARGRAMLQLGSAASPADRAGTTEPATVDDVIITENVFDKPYVAIADGGLPIRRLFVTDNEFGAYYIGVFLNGNRFDTARRFRVEDAVIVGNTFKPGSYLDVTIHQGAMASAIGASHRLDFSGNVADGTDAQYLYAPTDAPGWRAAFFWHLNGNGEMLLVARNVASCTGDKAGDGEAIAYDNHGNAFGFSGARRVVAATRDSVTVTGPLLTRQNGRDVNVGDYYVGHWLQIAAGPGVGQVRRIASYSPAARGAEVTFTVSPGWDVVPEPTRSRVSVGRQFWQVYTVDNVIDHRKPPCAKSNRTRSKGGGIVHWAQTADSAVEGNVQHDTDGIALQQSYSAEDPACPTCAAGTFHQYFVEVRGNTIRGEYDWSSDCSHSGLQISHGAAPTPTSPPPVMGYGVSLAHNEIDRADGLRGGAITIPLTWWQGPPPHDWEVVSNLLIHHNAIRNVNGRGPRERCNDAPVERVGIGLFRADMVWRTVLYANSCENVTRPLHDSGTETVRVCVQGVRSCECP